MVDELKWHSSVLGNMVLKFVFPRMVLIFEHFKLQRNWLLLMDNIYGTLNNVRIVRLVVEISMVFVGR